MTTLKSLLLISGCALLQPAEAGQMTAGELFEFCESSAEQPQIACRFYVLGVMEGLPLGGSAQKTDAGIWCIPEGTGNHEAAGLIKGEMTKLFSLYPGDSKMPAVSVVAAVLKRKYPCAK